MFFKGGHAAKWSKNMFHQEADASVFPIQTWGDFKQQFQIYFFSVNVDGDQKVWSQNKGESKIREVKSSNCFTIVY